MKIMKLNMTKDLIIIILSRIFCMKVTMNCENEDIFQDSDEIDDKEDLEYDFDIT